MAYTTINAWREILARVFDGFLVRLDETPEWLINPETRRRLKLDLVYPELGLAVRFVGLRGANQRGRVSLEEEQQQQVRDAARAEVCREHGIRLVTIDVLGSEPKTTLHELRLALSDVSRRLNRTAPRTRQQSELVERLAQARSRLEGIAARLRTPEQLQTYAELWLDRAYTPVEPHLAPQAGRLPRAAFRPGLAVRHATFGAGVVESVHDEANDQLVTVRFADGSQRTFAASLVGDKLQAATP